MNESGIGFFDSYVVGDGVTQAKNLPLKYFADETPTASSRNAVQSKGITEVYGLYVNNTKFVEVHTDSEGRILFGVKTDGTFYFGNGCPAQVKEYVSEYGYNKAAIDDLLNGKVDKVAGKTLINAEIAEKQEFIANADYLYVITDSANNVVLGIKKDGKTFADLAGVPKDIKDYVDSKDVDQLEIDVVTPSRIDAIVGDTVQLFYHSIFKCVNFEHYQIKAQCNVGNAYPRYYELTPTATGTYNIVFEILDDRGIVVGNKTTQIVVTSPSRPSSPKNILILGASIEENGEWASELKRRVTGNGTDFLSLGYDNINFVGRKSITYGGTQVSLEATGGYSYSSYLSTTSMLYRFDIVDSPITQVNVGDVYSNDKGTFEITEINLTDGVGNISCKAVGVITGTVWGAGTLTKVSGTGDATITYNASSGSGNPFAYNGELDIQQYATDYCSGQIDIVIFGEMFVNSISSARASVVSLAQEFVNAFPNIHVYIQMPNLKDVRGGLGVNYGANGWALGKYLDYQVFDFCNDLEGLFEDAEITQNIHFVNSLNEVDAVNGFKQTNKKVDTRSSVTEVFGVNGVHPSIVGYNLIADSMFRTLVGNNF